MRLPSGYLVLDRRTIKDSYYGPFTTHAEAVAWAEKHVPQAAHNPFECIVALWAPNIEQV